MLTSVVWVVVLLLPNMSEPVVKRYPMTSFEECLAKVKESGEGLKKAEGLQYRYMSGCEVTGNKADPA